jgi:hypothetical protein
MLYDTNYDPVPASGITCMDAASAGVDCATGPVRSVSLTPASSLTGSFYYLYANQNGVATQVTDLHGNPLQWFYAAGYVSVITP